MLKSLSIWIVFKRGENVAESIISENMEILVISTCISTLITVIFVDDWNPNRPKILQNAEIHVNFSSIIIIRSLGCMIPTQTGPKIEKFRRKSVTI